MDKHYNRHTSPVVREMKVTWQDVAEKCRKAVGRCYGDVKNLSSTDDAVHGACGGAYDGEGSAVDNTHFSHERHNERRGSKHKDIGGGGCGNTNARGRNSIGGDGGGGGVGGVGARDNARGRDTRDGALTGSMDEATRDLCRGLSSTRLLFKHAFKAVCPSLSS